jgi:hypothetical protein
VIDRDTGRLRFDLPRPSHNGGIVPVLALPSRILVKSKSSSFRSCPTNTLVPEVTVTGRAVLSRIVRQGTPKYVVSSSIPPESVTHDCMCIGSLTPARDRNMLDGSQKRNRGSNPASPRSQDSAGLCRFLERTYQSALRSRRKKRSVCNGRERSKEFTRASLPRRSRLTLNGFATH